MFFSAILSNGWNAQEKHMTDFIVAIPARFASTRLPGKPLQLIGGLPMIRHVADRALAAGASQVVIATDDIRVADAVRMDSVRICMTDAGHHSGTDRLAECARLLQWPERQIVVNLQGDEPFAPADGIRQVAALLADSACEMATLACPVRDADEFRNPNAVKVVLDAQGRALYFSRAPIPWPRDAEVKCPANALRHIGIYAYRAGFLKRFSQLPDGKLERLESLEQLRALEHGFPIAVARACSAFPAGVDTPADLAEAQRHWQQQRMENDHEQR
jgi:3-deoxy-manno-octulosonate cytidylyltransferase (CMP-KDO synthetase)